MLPFGYVLFLMTEGVFRRLEQSDGWDVGRDRAVVIVHARDAKIPDGGMDTQSGTMGHTGGTMARRPAPPSAPTPAPSSWARETS